MSMPMMGVPEGWDEVFNIWEKYLAAASKAERTVETRIKRMRMFARAFDVPPGDVTEDIVIDYVGQKKWAAETRHSSYVTLRTFFGWYSQHFGCDNPAKNLPKVHRNIPPPRPTPEDVYADALDNAPDDRSRLILLLAGNLGLRAGEIARLHLSCIVPDLLGASLRICGKGGVVRLLPLSSAMHCAITAHADPCTGWVFPGKIDGHLSPHYVTKLGSDALPEQWTLHTLRHRFGTSAYRHDRDLLTVQRLLGHAEVSTTQRYVEPPPDSMRATVMAVAIQPHGTHDEIADQIFTTKGGK